MKTDILSDTQDEIERTGRAVKQLIEWNIDALIHCGDLSSPEMIDKCTGLPFYFVVGDHDFDMVGGTKHVKLIDTTMFSA